MDSCLAGQLNLTDCMIQLFKLMQWEYFSSLYVVYIVNVNLLFIQRYVKKKMGEKKLNVFCIHKKTWTIKNNQKTDKQYFYISFIVLSFFINLK